MAIYQYLDASTGYVTERDMELLREEYDGRVASIRTPPTVRVGAPIIACYPEGAILYVPIGFRADGGTMGDGQRDEAEHASEIAALREAGYSDKLIAVLDYAGERNLPLIRLDADGDDEIDGLVFEAWET